MRVEGPDGVRTVNFWPYKDRRTILLSVLGPSGGNRGHLWIPLDKVDEFMLEIAIAAEKLEHDAP